VCVCKGGGRGVSDKIFGTEDIRTGQYEDDWHVHELTVHVSCVDVDGEAVGCSVLQYVAVCCSAL